MKARLVVTIPALVGLFLVSPAGAATIAQTVTGDVYASTWNDALFGTPAASPSGGNTYTTTMPLYTENIGSGTTTFAGDSITVLPGGSLSLTNYGTSMAAADVILDGGRIIPMRGSSGAQQHRLDGTLLVAAGGGTFQGTGGSSSINRQTFVQGILGGSGDLIVQGNAHQDDVILTNDANTYSGNWSVPAGSLWGQGNDSLGSGNITLGATGKLRADYDIQHRDATLTMDTGALFNLSNLEHAYGGVVLAGQQLDEGTYQIGDGSLTASQETLFTGTGSLSVASPEELKVDFGRSDTFAPRQPGWHEQLGFNANRDPLSATYTDTALRDEDAVTVTVSGQQYFRNYAAPVTGGDYLDVADVLRDYVLRTSQGTITLEFDGLSAGLYKITTYHHSTHKGVWMTISLDDALGSRVIDSHYDVPRGATPINASKTFGFFANGIDPVQVKFFRPTFSDDLDVVHRHSALNGFALVAIPEPSTFILAALGAIGLGFHGRRRRKRAA